jgi:catechol 2,3-dioxygenase-like lactoylglutathione lyase family enzyme
MNADRQGTDTGGVGGYPCAFTHIGLSVPSVDDAVEWYVNVLGFTLLAGPDSVSRDDGHAAQAAAAVFGPWFQTVRIAYLAAANGVALELFEFPDEHVTRTATSSGVQSPYSRPGFTHICVVDPDIRSRVDRIIENGGRARTEIWRELEDAPYRFCHCEDPFGNIIEIYSHSDEQVFANR